MYVQVLILFLCAFDLLNASLLKFGKGNKTKVTTTTDKAKGPAVEPQSNNEMVYSRLLPQKLEKIRASHIIADEIFGKYGTLKTTDADHVCNVMWNSNDERNKLCMRVSLQKQLVYKYFEHNFKSECKELLIHGINSTKNGKRVKGVLCTPYDADINPEGKPFFVTGTPKKDHFYSAQKEINQERWTVDTIYHFKRERKGENSATRVQSNNEMIYPRFSQFLQEYEEIRASFITVDEIFRKSDILPITDDDHVCNSKWNTDNRRNILCAKVSVQKKVMYNDKDFKSECILRMIHWYDHKDKKTVMGVECLPYDKHTNKKGTPFIIFNTLKKDHFYSSLRNNQYYWTVHAIHYIPRGRKEIE